MVLKSLKSNLLKPAETLLSSTQTPHQLIWPLASKLSRGDANRDIFPTKTNTIVYNYKVIIKIRHSPLSAAKKEATLVHEETVCFALNMLMCLHKEATMLKVKVPTCTRTQQPHALMTQMNQMHPFPYFACLSHFSVISSPSTGSPSCAAVNCSHPSQPLYVCLVLVCLCLLCDLTVTCLFHMFLHLLFFNMSRVCARFLFSLTALSQIRLFV